MASEPRATAPSSDAVESEQDEAVPAPPFSARTPEGALRTPEPEDSPASSAAAESEPERPSRPSESERPPVEERVSERTTKERKTRFESLGGVLRRGIEKSIEAGLNTFERSIETGRETTDAVRERLNEVKAPRDVAGAVTKALSEAKLPRELVSAVLGQLDETKNDVLRILAREFREFLEATDLATEMKNALTSLSFEVKTEIRFIPNDAGSGVKPDVRARTRIKHDPTRQVRRRRRPSRDKNGA